MTDVDTTQETGEQGATPAGDEAVDPAAAINRGKGLSLEAVLAGNDEAAKAAVEEFKQFAAEWNAAEEAQNARVETRMQWVRRLKDEHNIGFTAIGELLGNTSSLALYLYERAAGKTAKQIRAESQASRKAKEATRETDPNRKPARKQTPEEKAFRKQQREALRAFLEEQRRAAAERGEDTSEYDAGIAGADAEQAADDAED